MRACTRFMAAGAMLLASRAVEAQVIVTDLTTSNGGFTAQALSGVSNPWTYVAGTGWQIGGVTEPSVQRLLSPTLVATGTSFGLSLFHAYEFENKWDGGQVYVSVNGGAFGLLGVLGSPYDCTLNSIGSTNPRGGQDVFCGGSGGNVTDTFSGVSVAGSTYRFAFDGSWDGSQAADSPNWQIRTVTSSGFNVTTVPEPATVVLMAAGLFSLGVVARRKRSN